MHRSAQIIIGLISWLLLTSAASASQLMLAADQTDYSLNEHLSYLEDADGQLTFEQVSSGDYDETFQPLAHHGNQGVTRSVIWLKTTIDFSRAPSQQWILRFDYCPIEFLTLYARYPDGSVVQQRSGNLVPVSERPAAGRHFEFPLNVSYAPPGQPQQLELYLRIETRGPVIINTRLLDPTSYARSVSLENRMLGIIYGVLIAMILYNLFLYFSIRDRNYLHYVAYISAATWALAAHDGSWQELVAPISPWLSHNGIYYSICIAASLGAVFVRGFLNLPANTPRLNQWLFYLQCASLAALPLMFLLDNVALTYVATLLAASFGTMALLAAIICTRQGHRTARYFLLAWSALILGLFLSCLRYIGVTMESSLSHYFIHMGELAEVILLSFALADRINQMRAEKAQIQREAHEKLQETNIQLEKSMLLQRNFLTAVSHELRTPMNGIVGATDLLSDCQTSEEKLQYANDIYRSSRKMMSLVENILDFTDSESGEFRPFVKTFTLGELLEPLVVQFRGKAHRKGLKFEFSLVPDNHLLNRLLESDPRVIQKIVNQLLGNALKFTDQGQVSLSARLEPDGNGEASLTIKVQDTGIGMTPETLREIFVAFQQGDGSYKRQYEGLGIGLSLAKSLTDKLAGNLIAESRIGEGSLFTLTLSLKDTGREREAATDELPETLDTRTQPEPAKNKQILLVEDNPVNLKVITKMVEKQGYSTLSAENGAKAVELLQDYKVDMILMDCQMPVMDGFEATRCIRQMHNGNQHVPIVAVTANTMSEDEARCYDAGMNGFVPKPINQKIVQSVLKRWLGAGASADCAAYTEARQS